MKRKIFLTLLATLFTIFSYAQESITGFYGIKFGMTTAQVRNAIQSKSNTLVSKGNDDGCAMYNVQGGVSLSGIRFDRLTLWFKNDKLVKGLFYVSDSAGGDPNLTVVYQRVANSANTYANNYMSLKAGLLSKYGKASTTQETNTKHTSIWMKNGYRIDLEYQYDDHYDAPIMRQAYASLLVRYSSSTINTQDL